MKLSDFGLFAGGILMTFSLFAFLLGIHVDLKPNEKFKEVPCLDSLGNEFKDAICKEDNRDELQAYGYSLMSFIFSIIFFILGMFAKLINGEED